MDALKVDEWLERAARVVFAPHCLLCHQKGAEGRDLCAACTQALPWNRSACLRCALPMPHPATCGACLQRPPAMSETHAVFVYGFPLDRLAPRFKFHDDLAAGRLLSELMYEPLSRQARPDLLIPVPLHRERLRERGYDQALELARPLARRLRIPLGVDALQRVRATTPQSRLSAADRQLNLRRAFEINRIMPLPAHVALLDDVMTTGATLEAAARQLLRAGVSRVDAWVCARAPDPRQT